MDLNPEYPEKKPLDPKLKKGGQPSLPNEQELISGGIAGELVSAHGGASILRHIRVLHNLSEEKRKPGHDAHLDLDLDQPEIVKFLTSNHPSHLAKTEALKTQLDKSKRAVQILDETDLTGQSLYEFIPPELKREIEEQLMGMQNTETIQKTLEAEVSSNCGGIWDEYKKLKKQTEGSRQKTLEILLLGPETDTPADKTERGDLKSVRKQIDQVQTAGELIQLEKMRLVTLALTASPKDYPARKMEAEQILGPEFQMIEAQVNHMEDLMAKDLDHADPEMGPINHAEGLDLVSEEIKRRMVDVNGNESTTINGEQKNVLEAAYTNAIFSHHKPESNDDRVNRKISFILAASETISLGKEALFANTLKMIREMPEPEQSMEPDQPEDPDQPETSQGAALRDLAKKTAGQAKIKKTLGKILKTWPQVMAVGSAGVLWKGLRGQMNHHGIMYQFFDKRNKSEHGSQEDLQKVFAQAYQAVNEIS